MRFSNENRSVWTKETKMKTLRYGRKYFAAIVTIWFGNQPTGKNTAKTNILTFGYARLQTWCIKTAKSGSGVVQSLNTPFFPPPVRDEPGRAKRESRGPFLERPGNLTGPKSYFEIKFSRKVECVLTSNEVHFVSLADNFTVQFSNLLKLLSRMKNKTA